MRKNYNIIGLMSGTSLDGLDIAHCTFTKEDGRWSYQINACQGFNYSESWRSLLGQSVNMSALKLLELDIIFGKFLGEAVVDFLDKNRALEVDAVASHGHTVFHQPEKRLTHQIGSGQEIANITNLQVICDFRSQDVLLGGQGAPLVPIGDRDLLGEFDFCLNLGGISNISFQYEGKRVAYDIGPANMLLNYLVQKVGKTYDAEGRIASSGQINEELLSELNALPYYQLPFPKSTGYEWFFEQIVPIMERSTLSIPDQLCTAVHHEAQLVAAEIKKYKQTDKARLLVTGGGAKNEFFTACLREKCGQDIEVHIPGVTLIDFKEAMVFAFMAAKKLEGEVNCLCSVTGGAKDLSAGVIYYP